MLFAAMLASYCLLLAAGLLSVRVFDGRRSPMLRPIPIPVEAARRELR